MPKHSLHIFRAGRQTTAAGESIEFSADDLANCAKAYDPALHEAPICVGHPKHDLPAYGWIKSLTASKGDLHAERHQMNPEFVEAARAGAFKKISAAFYAPDAPTNPVPGVWYLRHVAMLGAMPPSVKGLRQAEFTDDEAGVVLTPEIEFSDYAITGVADLLSNLRDWIIDKFNLEAADRALPKWQIESVARMGAERPYVAAETADDLTRTAFREAPAGASGNPTHTPTTNPQETAVSTEKLTELQQQLDAANAATAAEKLRADGLAAAAAKATRTAREAAATEFAEGLVTADKLLPKDRALVAAVLCAVEADVPVEFGEGEDKKPVGTALRELLSSIKPHALNGKHLAVKGEGGVDVNDPSAVAGAAVEFQEAQRAKGIAVTTAEAVAHVSHQSV